MYKFNDFNMNNPSPKDVLIIVDVQKSFKKFYSNIYLDNVIEYSSKFKTVIQIWDNHVCGEVNEVGTDYLFKPNPNISITNDLHHFPNQKILIEKRYTHDIGIDYFKPYFTKDNVIKSDDMYNKGDIIPTKFGTNIICVDGKHKWFHIPMKMKNTFTKLKSKQDSIEIGDVILIGGSSSACLEDILCTIESIGIKVKVNNKYIYT